MNYCNGPTLETRMCLLLEEIFQRFLLTGDYLKAIANKVLLIQSTTFFLFLAKHVKLNSLTTTEGFKTPG